MARPSAGTLESLGYAVDVVPITPSDSTTFASSRGLLVGTSGALKFVTDNGSTRTLTNVPAGFYPWAVTKIFSTGTTASDLGVAY